MSHVVTIDCEINDLDSLKSACDRLGFEFKEGQRSYQWFGRWVGDSPMPEGMTTADLGHCDHAIKVPGSQYEVGVRSKPGGGYGLVWDYWDHGIRNAMGGSKGDKLVQAYATERTKKQARRMGYTVSEAQRQDGSIKLTLKSH